MTDLIAYLAGQDEGMLSLLIDLVNIESPTIDKSAVDVVGHRVVTELQKASIPIQKIPNEHVGDFWLGILPGVQREQKILIMCHMDTVWPVGTLIKRPVRIEGDKLFGPGAVDMKGGIVITLAVLRALQDLDIKPVCDVAVLFTSDEETGSKASREVIERLSKESNLVICMEPSAPGGALKTSRKGGMTVVVTTKGRAAHAGADHASGVNAIEEMAHQILVLQSLTNYELGTTISVGMVAGGVATNIVPSECVAKVDVRVTSPEEKQRISIAIQEMSPKLPGASLSTQIGAGRPPMPRNDLIENTFNQVRQIGWNYGFELSETSTGGASDANFTASLGIPVIDGMGVVGGGMHAVDEYVEIPSLVQRAQLLAAVLTEWKVE